MRGVFNGLTKRRGSLLRSECDGDLATFSKKKRNSRDDARLGATKKWKVRRKAALANSAIMPAASSLHEGGPSWGPTFSELEWEILLQRPPQGD
jgi:hypothetical protein